VCAIIRSAFLGCVAESEMKAKKQITKINRFESNSMIES
jgi:hypothetical protein